MLGFEGVDAGGGWLIFALPPAEVAAHPSRDRRRATSSTSCATTSRRRCPSCEAKGVEFTGPVEDVGWGLLTAMKLPGGDELGLYEPRHPSPHA